MKNQDQWLLEIPMVQDFMLQDEEKSLEKGLKKGRKDARQEARKDQLTRQGKLLLTIVQGRFPDLVEFIKPLIGGISEIAVLDQIIAQISLATSTQEAEQAVIGSLRTRATSNIEIGETSAK